ncbi:MAG: hypothetical protein H6652_10080 [Ardenticatenaceae bacterium]|nr:hypothetical protein [Ardenticatenaceae bacterium]
MSNTYTIRELKIAEATEDTFVALHRFEDQMRAERLPDDPPRSLEAAKANWLSIPPFVQVHMWLVWDAGETAVIARGLIAYTESDDNRHLGQVAVEVLPAHRQQGLACQLLALIVQVAEAQERRLLIGNTNGRVPAGDAFMKRLGGSRGVATHINQLALTELDQDLMNSWLQRGQKQSAEFELGLWTGPYPEAQLDEIAALHEVMNQQPYDDLDVEDFHITGEQLRQIEANLAAQHIERWTFYVQERATKKLAGYTELTFVPDRLAMANQGDTGVFPEFRGRGLGRWLKAAMLAKVLAERPSVQFVRTGNADSNAAMLKINREMGFRPYMSQTIWQIETAKVKAYLEGK